MHPPKAITGADAVQRARSRPLFVHAGTGTLLAIAILARWASGLPSGLWMPYWYLSYSEGFIRRAFIGTFTLPLLAGRSLAAAERIINGIEIAASLALLALLLQVLRRVPPIVVLIFLVSNALPFLAQDFGRLDPWVMLTAIGAVLLLVDDASATGDVSATHCGSARLLAAAILCAIVPLIHEGGLWLLLPVLGGVWLLRPQQRPSATFAAAAALVAAAALWLFATTHFSWPDGMPPEIRDDPKLPGFIALQLGQAPHLYRPWQCETCVSPGWQIVLLSMAPCLVIAAEAWRGFGWRVAAVVMLGVLATWSVCFIASDTDRLMAWGPITAALLVFAADVTHRGRRLQDNEGPSIQTAFERVG